MNTLRIQSAGDPVNPGADEKPDFTTLALELCGDLNETFALTCQEAAAEMARREEIAVTPDDICRMVQVALQDTLEQAAQMDGGRLCDFLRDDRMIVDFRRAVDQEVRTLRNKQAPRNPWKSGVLEAVGATWCGGRE